MVTTVHVVQQYTQSENKGKTKSVFATSFRASDMFMGGMGAAPNRTIIGFMDSNSTVALTLVC